MYSFPLRLRGRQPNRQQYDAIPPPAQTGLRTAQAGQLTLPFRPLHVGEDPFGTPRQVPSWGKFTFDMPLRPGQHIPHQNAIHQPTTATPSATPQVSKGQTIANRPSYVVPATPANSRASNHDSDNDNVTDAPTTAFPDSGMGVEYVQYTKPTFTPGELWQVSRGAQADNPNEAPPNMPQEWRALALMVAQPLSSSEKIASIDHWRNNIGRDIGRILTPVDIEDKTDKEDFFWAARRTPEAWDVWQRRIALGQERWEALEWERKRRFRDECFKRSLGPDIDAIRRRAFDAEVTRRMSVAAGITRTSGPMTAIQQRALVEAEVARRMSDEAAARRADVENRRRTWSATLSTSPARSGRKKKRARVSWAGDDGRIINSFDEFVEWKTEETPTSMEPVLR